jgi:hypothetical protein
MLIATACSHSASVRSRIVPEWTMPDQRVDLRRVCHVQRMMLAPVQP